MRLRDMKYIGFKHQRENKQNRDNNNNKKKRSKNNKSPNVVWET